MTRTISLFAALALIALAVAGSATTSATSPPSADMFAIDMDPSATPANTGGSVGSIENCAAMSENNVLDADEDATDAIDLDVVTAPGGIPAANPAIAYMYTLGYPANTIITSQASMYFPGSVGIGDPIPDSDGAFAVNESDPTFVGKSGPGALDRIRLQTQPGVTAGLYSLMLGSAAHVDTTATAHVPDALQNSLLEIDGAGCASLADVEMLGQNLSLGQTIYAGFPRTLSINGTIRNNGPNPGGFSADVNVAVTLPGDCTADGQSSPAQLTNTFAMPPPGMGAFYVFAPAIICTTGGAHQLTSEACADSGLIPDSNPTNNCDTDVVDFDVDASDIDGDGFTNEKEAGTPLCANAVNDDDHDDAVVDDGCPGGPPQAGAFSEAQFNIGTDPLVACTPGGSIDVWPPELAIDSIPNSTNIINIADLSRFVAPVRRISTSPGDPNFDPRFDLSPGRGGPAKWINVIDMSTLLTFVPRFSPLFDHRAFNGPAAC